jgi:hypothetical protein
LNARLLEVVGLYKKYEDLEDEEGMKTGIDYLGALNYDMPTIMMEWTNCEDQEGCKWFIQTRLFEKGISIGDFVKSVMKVSVCAKEWSSIAEQIGAIELLHKLSMIDGMILKYVTTSQSLYI